VFKVGDILKGGGREGGGVGGVGEVSEGNFNFVVDRLHFPCFCRCFLLENFIYMVWFEFSVA